MSKKIIALFLACGLIFATGCGKKNNDDKKKDDNKGNTTVTEPSANTDAAVVGEQTIDGLKFTNITLISEGESTVYTADVVNTTDAAIDVKSFNVTFKDKDGKEIVTILVFVGSNIAPNESASVSSSVDISLLNAKSVEYVRNY